MNKEKICKYIEIMGYLTRAEGIITYEKQRKEGEVEVETVNVVKRIKRDPMLPPHLGNTIDIYI